MFRLQHAAATSNLEPRLQLPQTQRARLHPDTAVPLSAIRLLTRTLAAAHSCCRCCCCCRRVLSACCNSDVITLWQPISVWHSGACAARRRTAAKRVETATETFSQINCRIITYDLRQPPPPTGLCLCPCPSDSRRQHRPRL